METWKAALAECRHVAVDIDHRLAAKFAVLVLTDMGKEWSTVLPVGFGRPRHYHPERSGQADCLATTYRLDSIPGQRTIWLSKDTAVVDFIHGDLSQIAIGIERHPGVLT